MAKVDPYAGIVEDQRRGLVQSLNAEGVLPGLMEVVEIKKQDRKQHQHRTKQSVEEELDGGVKFTRTAPDADQQVHGNQHRFPEHKEEKEIERHEDAQHTGLQHQEPDVVFLDPIFDRRPR